VQMLKHGALWRVCEAGTEWMWLQFTVHCALAAVTVARVFDAFTVVATRCGLCGLCGHCFLDVELCQSIYKLWGKPPMAWPYLTTIDKLHDHQMHQDPEERIFGTR